MSASKDLAITVANEQALSASTLRNQLQTLEATNKANMEVLHKVSKTNSELNRSRIELINTMFFQADSAIRQAQARKNELRKQFGLMCYLKDGVFNLEAARESLLDITTAEAHMDVVDAESGAIITIGCVHYRCYTTNEELVVPNDTRYEHEYSRDCI